MKNKSNKSNEDKIKLLKTEILEYRLTHPNGLLPINLEEKAYELRRLRRERDATGR